MAGRKRISTEERFWEKVDTSGECWLWAGWTDRDGYGKIRWRNARGEWCYAYAHRASFELEHGRRPGDGMDVHHVCENRSCVRPDHLEEVTRGDHASRHISDHCSKGHELVGDNLYEWNGRRYCAECRRQYRKSSRDGRAARHTPAERDTRVRVPLPT